ncbi:MAG: hypothetical protein K6U03_02210, partial [Firmicutes bacterium]|nr:hypothetical protein [Bacillota bacterium]
IRQIVLKERNLLVLAEGIDATMLVIDCMQNDGHIYFINAEEDDAKLIDYGNLFSNALIKYVKQK